MTRFHLEEDNWLTKLIVINSFAFFYPGNIIFEPKGMSKGLTKRNNGLSLG